MAHGRNGFVKLDRCLIEKGIFKNEKLLKVWIWCLMRANHKTTTEIVGLQKVTIQPGQFITGRFRAAEDLSMNPSTVWAFLKSLEENESITIMSKNKYSVINIVNWSYYQLDKYSQNRENKFDNKMTTNGEILDNKNDSISPDEYGPEDIHSDSKNDNKKTELSENPDTDKKYKNLNTDIEHFFESIWTLYPEKKGKNKVSQKKKKELYELGYDVIAKCIIRYTDYVEQKRAEGFRELQYQHGRTFFNNGYVDYLDENYREATEGRGLGKL